MKPVSTSTLSTDIQAFYRQTRPFREDIEEKEKLYQYIKDSVDYLHQQFVSDLKVIDQNNKFTEHNITKMKFLENMRRSQSINTPWTVFKFGSSSWGTSCRESDTDVAVRLNFRNNRSVKMFLLNQLSQIMSENDTNGALYVQSILHAKYPIIRIHHLHNKRIKFDISIADEYCFKRDKLIAEYIQYYQNKFQIPMQTLIVFIKYWSKQRGINNAYYCYLNSFGFTLLIIKFIQSLIGNKNKNISNKSLSFFVYEFFVFYAFKYDGNRHAIRINSDYTFDRKQDTNCLMEIIDPVDNENNVAQNVGYYQYNRIKLEFVRSVEIYDCYEKKQGITLGMSSLFHLLTESEDGSSFESDDGSSFESISGYSSNTAGQNSIGGSKKWFKVGVWMAFS